MLFADNDKDRLQMLHGVASATGWWVVGGGGGGGEKGGGFAGE